MGFIPGKGGDVMTAHNGFGQDASTDIARGANNSNVHRLVLLCPQHAKEDAGLKLGIFD
jgi:hypothetical protein